MTVPRLTPDFLRETHSAAIAMERPMPVVFKSGNLKFFFYSNEGNPREPMHIHVRGPDGEAKLWIEPAIGFADSKGFNPRELAVIIREVIKNRSAIERAWHEHFGN